MKFIKLLFALTILTSCTETYEAENSLWSCVTEKTADLSIDINKEIALHEEFLIKEGYFKDNSGASYIENIKSMVETGELKYAPENSRWRKMLVEIYKDFNLQEKCYAKGGFYQTKAYNVVFEMSNILQKSKNINQQKMLKPWIKHYEANDFNHPFYKFTYFLSFTVREQEASIDETQLFLQNFDRQDIITLKLDNQENLFINEEKTTVSELPRKLKKFMINEETLESIKELDKGMLSTFDYLVLMEKAITIVASRNASYESYLNLQNAISETYSYIYQLSSKEIFQLDFDSLSIPQQKIIKGMFPKHHFNSEPNHLDE
ncbi:hypothetical protein EAX61_13945 [Dokdonia sinensis]|uniref:Lipoprotein n=1 Tax=Dokdonia sinensis TaxID=2479847 RepID=A0A3M0G5X5_9FLAO|nr:hypothetical protein [Dokdonia sinensis]RMB56509.1 hypothetical protein EAX61_13945 [Dokdonia sinensis]